MRPLNATISPISLGAIQELVEREDFSPTEIAQGVAKLSRIFTKARGRLRRTYLDDRLLGVAYLQYFLPVNLAKIQVLLNEMPTLEPVKCFSVLDLGSGPGTGALAILDWWHQRGLPHALSVTAVDGSTAALKQARQLWDRYCRATDVGEVSLQACVEDLERRAWVDQARQKGPFNLIIIANCLNEIYANVQDSIERRVGLVGEALSILAPNGTVMIIEPALRETSRALHQVRDRLLQERWCSIYSPCLHGQGCPALAKPDDWCHEERAWEPPGSIQEIDEQVGFIKDALKFSYLLLRKDGKTIVERRPDLYRVVSELRTMKGEKRAWLCNEQGRQEVGRQDRIASPNNEPFDQWHRGAIVQIERIGRKEKAGKKSALGRIEQDAVVQIVRQA